MESGNSMDKKESGNSMDKEKSGGGGQRPGNNLFTRLRLKISEGRKLKKAADAEAQKYANFKQLASKDAFSDRKGSKFLFYHEGLRKILSNPENEREVKKVTKHFREEYNKMFVGDEKLASSVPYDEESYMDKLENNATFEFEKAVDKYYENTRNLKKEWYAWSKRYKHLYSKLSGQKNNDDPKNNNAARANTLSGTTKLMVAAKWVLFGGALLVIAALEVGVSYSYFSQSENISNADALNFSMRVLIGTAAALAGTFCFGRWIYHYDYRRVFGWLLLGVIGFGLYYYADSLREIRTNVDLPVESAPSGVVEYDAGAFAQGREDAIVTVALPSPDEGKSLSELLTDQWFLIILVLQAFVIVAELMAFDGYQAARKCRQKLDDAQSTFEIEALAVIDEQNNLLEDLFDNVRERKKKIPAAVQDHRAHFDRVDKKALRDGNKDAKIYHRLYCQHKSDHHPPSPEITEENAEKYSVGIPKGERKYLEERETYLNTTFLPEMEKHINVLQSLLNKIILLLEEFRNQMFLKIRVWEEEAQPA